MKVLVACEESQRVCMAFRERGHEAYSCDMIPCSGGHPEWHILEDAKNILMGGVCRLQLNRQEIYIDRWDMIIAHPPCTYLTNAATRSHSLKSTPLNRINGRVWNRISAMEFFMMCIMADCDHIAVENPIGIMSTVYRKPDQIIHPYMFAESVDDAENYVTKATCLWLKNLPPLETNDLKKPNNKELFGVYSTGKAKTWEDCAVRGSCARSKTFQGIANAMAEQWGKELEE